MNKPETTTLSQPIRIVCPHCQAINRVPPRLTEQPKCGKCHLPLFTAHPIELTTSTFELQATRNDIPLVVDFWAPWCGPCQAMASAYKQAAALLEPHYRLAKVNSDGEPALATRYSIRSIPTLALFKGGREIARQPGAMGAQDIVRWVRSYPVNLTDRCTVIGVVRSVDAIERLSIMQNGVGSRFRAPSGTAGIHRS